MRTLIRTFAIVLFLSLVLNATGSAQAPEPIRVAIDPFNAPGIGKSLGAALEPVLSEELSGSPRIIVIEEDRLDDALDYIKLQQSGLCNVDYCPVEPGKFLSAQKIITGTISKLGKKYIFSLKLIDVETLQAEYTDKTACMCAEEDLDQPMITLGRRLRKYLETGNKPPTLPVVPTAPTRSPQSVSAPRPPANLAPPVDPNSDIDLLLRAYSEAGIKPPPISRLAPTAPTRSPSSTFSPRPRANQGPPVDLNNYKGLLFASNDSEYIKFWDVGTGQAVEALQGQKIQFLEAFSPDGKLLASNNGYSINLWEMGTGQLVRTLVGHKKAVISVAFSPDGKLLAAGSAGKKIKLWDVGSGREIRSIVGDKEWVMSVAFSPDGQLLAFSGTENTIKLWDVNKGKVVRKLKGHRAGVTHVIFSPDGNLLASASSDQTVKLWNVSTGQIVSTPLRNHGTGPIVFSPDGKLLASAGFDKPINILDVTTGQTVSLLGVTTGQDGHDVHVFSAAFSHDGRLLVSGGGKKCNGGTSRGCTGIITIWDVVNGQELRTIETAKEVGRLAFQPQP